MHHDLAESLLIEGVTCRWCLVVVHVLLYMASLHARLAGIETLRNEGHHTGCRMNADWYVYSSKMRYIEDGHVVGMPRSHREIWLDYHILYAL